MRRSGISGTLLAVLLGMAGASSLRAQIVVLEPDGSGDSVPEGRDYAKWELANSWNMDGAGCPDTTWDDRWECDVFQVETENVDNPRFTAEGVYTGTAESDPKFWLVYPGLKSVVNLSNGFTTPVSSALYRFFSAKVRFTGSRLEPPLDSAPLRVLYTQGTQFSDDAFGRTDPQKTGRVPPDTWQIVHFDLAVDSADDVARWGDFAAWPGIRVDPTNEAGVEFEFDWIRLTGVGGSQNLFTVEWTASGTGTQPFVIEAVDEDGASLALASDLPGGSGDHSAEVDLAPLPAGAYSIRVRSGSMSGESCAGCLTVNAAPTIRVREPNKSGDTARDYATVVRQDAWGPFQPGELESVSVVDETYAGGVYAGENPFGDRDPRVFLPTPEKIDTVLYRMISYKFEVFPVDPDDELVDGRVARVLWGNDRASLETGDDVWIEEGLHEYWLGDMDRVPVEGGQTGRWSGPYSVLRFDPHEFDRVFRFELHSLDLAPWDVARPDFRIEWEDEDPDDDASIQLFVDPDRQPMNGNEVEIAPGAGLREDPDGTADELLWNPADDAVPPGLYFVLARISDEANEVLDYGKGPLRVRCDPVEYPDLSISGVASGTVSETACQQIEARDYSVPAGSDVTLRAGARVVLDDGVQILDGGRLTVEILPSLTLPLE